MAKKITKSINSQYNPTLMDRYMMYLYGGKINKYGTGGYMVGDEIKPITTPTIGTGTPTAKLGATDYKNANNNDPKKEQGNDNSFNLSGSLNTAAGMAGGATNLYSAITAETNGDYFAERNQSLQGSQGVTDVVSSAIPVAGVFDSLADTATSLIAPKDEYGVSDSSDFMNALSGVIDPGEASGRAFNDISEGTFDWDTAMDLFLPGARGNYTNDQNKLQRDNLFRAENNATMAGNIPGQPTYAPTFGAGGKISSSEITKGTKEEMEHTSSKKISKKTAMDHLKEDPKYYSKLKKAGLADSYNMGGNMSNVGQMPENITDRISNFENGGLHSENGGIPIGQNAMVERGETMYTNKKGEKYIFSDKF